MNKKTLRAKELLEQGALLAIVGDAQEITFNERGIKALLGLRAGGFCGASAADIIVGKAAAMLLVRAGISEVYAQTVSLPALEFLKKAGVRLEYGRLAQNIIRRDGKGICPMEETVTGVDDVEKAYVLLCEKAGVAH